MCQNGRYGAALLAVAPTGVILVAAGLFELALVAGVTTLALVMVPNLDQRVPGIVHRGPTHKIWFALVTGVLMAAALVAVGTAGPVVSGVTGFAVGAGTTVSHIAADVLTLAGVCPWQPIDYTHY